MIRNILWCKLSRMILRVYIRCPVWRHAVPCIILLKALIVHLWISLCMILRIPLRMIWIVCLRISLLAILIISLWLRIILLVIRIHCCPALRAKSITFCYFTSAFWTNHILSLLNQCNFFISYCICSIFHCQLSTPLLFLTFL